MNKNAAIEDPRPAAASAMSIHMAATAGNGILRHSPWDALLVGGTMLHAALLALLPSLPVVAIGMWWNANTVAHNFIHLPFFRSRRLNVMFSAVLTLLLGFPQSLWRARHLAHHRDEPFRWTPLRREWLVEGALVLLLWTALLAFAPKFFAAVYLPGWLLGLGLCQVQGWFEHARGTVSHHGWLYNWLFFNDGYHVEHHAHPARHWTELPRDPLPEPASLSRWPAVLRWLDSLSLDGLEELVCRSRLLQRFVLGVHEKAWRQILPAIPAPRRVVIVGGGLFPRTALLLRRLVPNAKLTIVDMREDRIESARQWLGDGVTFVRGFCAAENLNNFARDADLIVIPLALRGAKEDFYRSSLAKNIVVHDWLWRRRGRSAVVSWTLLKRLNLVTP